MPKFQPGDKVRLTYTGPNMHAVAGSTAEVYERPEGAAIEWDDKPLLYVRWVEVFSLNGATSGQRPGGYYEKDFELLEPVKGPW